MSAIELLALLEKHYGALVLTNGRSFYVKGWGKDVPPQEVVERFGKLRTEIGLILMDRVYGEEVSG